ncbi:hypothetical protein TRIUR3_11486 [Triticum urartu]|uniref:Uncharacterized protein n=1 Tax=Triticum urartu TaxID=4572 RepID=M7ZXD9_TRIUA|nr:hypothetical protein TRIUR3_11486 [Triticum urartu]
MGGLITLRCLLSRAIGENELDAFGDLGGGSGAEGTDERGREVEREATHSVHRDRYVWWWANLEFHRVYEFLSRLRKEFEPRRAQLFARGRISLMEALSEIRAEETRLRGAGLLELLSSGWGLASQSIPWKEVEVRMYALSMVADTILQDGSPFDFSVVMHFVNILSSRTPAELNGCQFLVYKSFGDVIGSYSKWLSSSKSNIKPLLLFCASGISKSISSNSCSVALRKLCEDASSFIHEPPILEILFWISEGMGEGNLRIEDEEEIISAITHALCSILDKELRKTSLARLLCSSYSAVEKIIPPDASLCLRLLVCVGECVVVYIMITSDMFMNRFTYIC